MEDSDSDGTFDAGDVYNESSDSDREVRPKKTSPVRRPKKGTMAPAPGTLRSHTPTRRKNAGDRETKGGRNRHTFTESEDERLLEAVKTQVRVDGTIKWKEVAQVVNKRLTFKQCLQHYNRVILCKKGVRMTDDELIELYHYVKQHNEKMSYISKSYYDCYYPDNQLRYYYKRHIKDNKQLKVRYDKMTQEELDVIIQVNQKSRLESLRGEGAGANTQDPVKQDPSTEEQPEQSEKVEIVIKKESDEIKPQSVETKIHQTEGTEETKDAIDIDAEALNNFTLFCTYVCESTDKRSREDTESIKDEPPTKIQKKTNDVHDLEPRRLLRSNSNNRLINEIR
ncbi:Myb-like protein M [Acrasis kona]|uniref:Myb-like protein M n=1 Tax=Acrasis kona TaxID=1008807 RepID=A0AAW2ZPT6_9EUKA